MEREIKLNGGEISILKTLGLSGSPLIGKLLLDRVEMESAELIDTLGGLIEQGYIISTKVNIQSAEDIERSAFRVNSSYARDLRDTLKPGRRREERSRRSRR
jgi:hypothetical protein